MADRLRVRIDSCNPAWCSTADGYRLFACAWRHARVAVIRPGGKIPFAWLESMAAAAEAVETDRGAA